MSRFNESNSRIARILARNEGQFFSGIAREGLGKLMLKPGFRKLARPFLKEAKPEKWLFVVGCYNSGTTILRRLLESHPDIAATVREGAKLTDAFPNLEVGGWPRMMYKNQHLWDLGTDGAEQRAKMARQDWSIWFDASASVFFEKSIDHSTRIAWLNRHFPNAHFLWITRNGYCVNEGIMRRAKPFGAAKAEVGERYPAELTARQWVAFDDHIRAEMAEVPRGHAISYEALMAQPVETLTGVFAFLGLSIPEMGPAADGIAIDGHHHELADQNAASLARLTDAEKDAMRPIMADAMRRHGYPLD